MENAPVVRRGFTLVEVLVALVLISGVALTMGGAVARLSSSAARDGQEMRAVELVRERLASVAGDPAYAQLESRYNGTETGAALDGFTRRTTIQRILQSVTGAGTLDYKIV